MTGSDVTKADELSTECPVCGKVLPYDRWDDNALEGFCSPECRTYRKKHTLIKLTDKNGRKTYLKPRKATI